MKYIYDVYNQNLIDSGVRDVIKDIKGNTWEASSRFENGSVDFVFIDADHNYESVKKDILSWLPKMREGGIMSGHDYHNNTCGVKQAVDELFPNVTIGINNIWMVNF
jgi:predicted O-methyltransferase YrrM